MNALACLIPVCQKRPGGSESSRSLCPRRPGAAGARSASSAGKKTKKKAPPERGAGTSRGPSPRSACPLAPTPLRYPSGCRSEQGGCLFYTLGWPRDLCAARRGAVPGGDTHLGTESAAAGLPRVFPRQLRLRARAAGQEQPFPSSRAGFGAHGSPAAVSAPCFPAPEPSPRTRGGSAGQEDPGHRNVRSLQVFPRAFWSRCLVGRVRGVLAPADATGLDRSSSSGAPRYTSTRHT